MVEDKISNNICLSSPVKIVWPFLILAFSWKYKITKSKCWYMYLIIIIHNQTVNNLFRSVLCIEYHLRYCFVQILKKGFVVYFGWFYALMYPSKTKSALYSQWHLYREQERFTKHLLIYRYWNIIVCIHILFCEIVIHVYCLKKSLLLKQ